MAGAQGNQGAQGATGPTGAQGAAASDRRLKKDIKNITDSIKKIKKIRGVRFFWKTNPFFDISQLPKDNIGFIAQEIKQVIPDLVFGSEEHGYGVKYEDMVALCIEAIKEQSTILELSKEQLINLEKIALEKGLV